MRGYGFSVWLKLPSEIKKQIRVLLRDIGVEAKHELHLTLRTKFETRTEANIAAVEFPRELKFAIWGSLLLLPKSSCLDPYHAWAFPALVQLDGTSYSTFPHVSAKYLENKQEAPRLHIPYLSGTGRVCVVDTQDPDPLLWS